MVRFEGFGLNWRTGLLVLLVAAMLAGTMIVVKPVAVQDGSQANAAVAPCRPHAWQSRWVKNGDSGLGWSIYQKVKIAWNGCDVKAVPSTIACWTGFLLGIGFAYWNCSTYREYTNTAYGQQLVVRSGWQVSMFFNGFPVKTNHLLCAWYDRNGQKTYTHNGAFDVVNESLCGF